jgi:hypothetical protein
MAAYSPAALRPGFRLRFDAATMTTLSLNINASGAVSLATGPLITPEEVAVAVRKQVAYRAPGA